MPYYSQPTSSTCSTIPIVDLARVAKPRRRQLVEPELNARRKHLAAAAAAPRLVHGHVWRNEGGGRHRHRLAVRVEHSGRRVRVRVVLVVAVATTHPHPVQVLSFYGP